MDTNNTTSQLSLLMDGEWFNPHSKNTWFFYTHPFNAAKGKMSIVQKGSSEPIMLPVEISHSDDQVRLRIVGSEYNINLVTTDHGSELQIIVPGGDTIRLQKKKAKQLAKQFSTFAIL